MSCIAATAPTLLPLVIPAAIIAFRVAPVVGRSLVAAHEKRVAARAQAKVCANVAASPEKAPPAIEAIHAMV